MGMKGHNNMVRTIDVEPKGQYVASGCDDGTMKVWEIGTGRCLKTWDMGGVVKSLAWCPNSALSLIAVAVESVVYLINTGLGDKLINTRTDELLGEEPDNAGYVPPARVSQADGTVCPAGCCPEQNWFCCPDNMYCAATAADCPFVAMKEKLVKMAAKKQCDGTVCPAGCCPEQNWFCCPDNMYCAV